MALSDSLPPLFERYRRCHGALVAGQLTAALRDVLTNTCPHLSVLINKGM